LIRRTETVTLAPSEPESLAKWPAQDMAAADRRTKLASGGRASSPLARGRATRQSPGMLATFGALAPVYIVIALGWILLAIRAVSKRA
jgi:hypothetical protein